MKKLLIGATALVTVVVIVTVTFIGMMASLLPAASAEMATCEITQENTPPGQGGGDSADAEKNAKKIFDHLTDKDGKANFSGAGGAGAVANAERESSFNPQAVNPSGGVAGFFQWSGWGHTLNGDRIHSEGSIKGTDLSTLTIENQFKLVDHELRGSKAPVRTKVGKATDPQQAALDWSEYYEGVALTDNQTKAEELKRDALKWYTKFDGASIPDSIKDGVNEGAEDNADDAYNEVNDNCETGSGTGEQVEGGIKRGTYYADLTPEQKKAIGKRAKFEEYPDDSVAAPWGHQCTWYVYYRGMEFGFPFGGAAQGNGNQFAENNPNMQVDQKPRAHAAVTFEAGQLGSSSVGHVAFVEYMNPDGSLIVSESNVVEGHMGMDASTATQPQESYWTISAKDAKTLTYVSPKG